MQCDLRAEITELVLKESEEWGGIAMIGASLSEHRMAGPM